MNDVSFDSINDYENDLKKFLESDFIEEEVSEMEGNSENEENSEIQEETEQEPYFDLSKEIIEDLDFSMYDGEFTSSLNGLNRAYDKRKKTKKVRRQKPLNNEIVVKRRATLYGKKTNKGEAKTTKRIIVPSTQKVIIEGVDKFIMGEDDTCNSVKNIGYYKCKKLRELIFTINNDSVNDFYVELFNPSMPLDYLHSTSGNLNNKIQVAGGNLSYTDVLFNLLSNPTIIPNAKITFAGVNVNSQINEPLIFDNKRIDGEQKVNPIQLGMHIDTMQVFKEIVFFDIIGSLGRPFIPNGMDVIRYKVLAGSTVTFAFFYGQRDLRKIFFKEARTNKILL